MDTDDLEPLTAKAGAKDMEDMSIAALGEYIEELKAEIDRAQAAIEAKQAARAGAEAIFKS